MHTMSLQTMSYRNSWCATGISEMAYGSTGDLQQRNGRWPLARRAADFLEVTVEKRIPHDSLAAIHHSTSYSAAWGFPQLVASRR